MKSYLQRMGRSLQLPVAVLPAAALLVGIGHWLPAKWAVAQFLQAGGNAILGQLALLFAVGLALGMSKDKDGAAALAGVVAYFVPVSVLSPSSVALLKGIKESQVDPSFGALSGNVFIGIIAGLIAAALYNRFHETKLPMALSFFSGKRLVPIMSALVMLFVTVLLFFVWPPVYEALVAFGKFFVSLGAVGAGLYGFFNRLLIPTGLHQALNSVFWFNVAGINDIGKFWANEGVKGVTGMYMGGFFPVMMFGLPAGAYAIYRNARPERKKETASLMMAGAFASFFTGVTEPLEFSFMFVAWPLYVLHAVFTGLSLGFAAFMHWTAGFTFSAGLVDFVLSSRMPIANMPYMLLVQGLVMAVIYYFGFNFAIQKFNLMTPGREPVEADAADSVDVAIDTDDSDDKYSIQAKKIYTAIGGKDNITSIDNCTTRLRLQLKDTDTINKGAIKGAGAIGMNVLDKTNLQIVIGTEVQFVADALTNLYKQGAPIGKITSNAATPTQETKVSENVNSGAVDTFYTPTAGQLLAIEDVNDPTFSQKMLGDGYAVEPSDGKVVSPVDGEIATVFPTKHAIGIKTDNGLEVLVHMGLDTVELKGKPFIVNVSEGQKVRHGDVLATADLQAIKQADKGTTMIVIITNMPAVGYMKFDGLARQVGNDEEVVKVTLK
ncbi:N-acetylglucosamine-specific PTS transporter subunit IIBC [Pediococcus damnosus]|nr:N-acetylglucosamine-specific PTS transporter subunit IIBC [Pediococcus damnosus]AMV60483.1 PTS system, N-acetylglucosamine-specific IIA component [Pediococcus damnosus]AMV63052.1 PTS system, N-acetylglucosamine-specific IIA component [Pediococcus damnosus]AMV64795.1 PTS system, N-acetylglucosamine-specific IIA component [Pediococcus damnosus]AMV69339.1 PTS system, N-acetylglucosamine-specific IIA component [Pediococcus damnosus]KJU74398.1 PTS N-acetylglucosamine transporter subunit IIABC [P